MSLDSEVTRRTLIVARMHSGDAPAVAQIFGESDAGELPHMLGVRRRDLFHFHGLYVHLVEARDDLAEVQGLFGVELPADPPPAFTLEQILATVNARPSRSEMA